MQLKQTPAQTPVTSDKLAEGTSRVLSESGMHCLEVWGGSGESDACLMRPGVDVWVCSAAHSGVRVGGDLHLVSSCASGRVTRLLLAEVCGPAPLFGELAAKLRDLMKQNINIIQQARLIKAMNRELHGASSRGAFASSLLGTYFAPTRSFSLCNAGHPPPLLYRAKEQRWSLVKESNRALTRDLSLDESGVVEPEEHQNWSSSLRRGDMLLCYSNALTECSSASGVTLGVNGIQRLVEGYDAHRPESIASRLISETRDAHPHNLRQEDASVMLCRASDTPVAWKDTLLAPLRLFQSVSDKTRFG